jgi:spore maturation protein CgeB
MPTARRFNRRAYQCSLYEAQDVLASIDDVDLIELEPEAHFRLRESVQRRLVYRDVSRRLVHLNPGLRRVRLEQDYDLFIAVCQNHWDLLYVNAIDDWKGRCRTSVCWLDELWAADMQSCRHWLHALTQFDHVFIGCRGTVEVLSRTIDRPCRWLPGAVDLSRFSPYPAAPQRCIDVYSIGRRWEGMHAALLHAGATSKLFYVYDTIPAMANMQPYDPRQHRELFASIARRSRCFVVAPAKMNLPQDTRGQVEIGYRYFEGAAAGAVMIGQVPDCDAFREAFPWPEAVIPVDADGTDVVDVVTGLMADPVRAERIGRRNAAEALVQHDWSHRWHEVLRVAGLEPAPAMLYRHARLRDLAACATGAPIAGSEIATTALR